MPINTISFDEMTRRGASGASWKTSPTLRLPFAFALVFWVEMPSVLLVLLTPTTADVPLATDPHGVVRVGGTRVTLDSIVGAFRSGATAEEIAQQFPTVTLPDVYQVIAYYLRHAAEVDAYLSSRQQEAADLRREIETRFDPRGLRARLLARRSAANR